MNEQQKRKRKKIETYIYDVLSIIDKTGTNTEKYKKIFKSMSDKDFLKWIKDFEKNDDNHFFLEVVPFKNEPTIKDLKEASKFMKVPLDEYVYYRHDDNKDNPLRSPYPVPVG